MSKKIVGVLALIVLLGASCSGDKSSAAEADRPEAAQPEATPTAVATATPMPTPMPTPTPAPLSWEFVDGGEECRCSDGTDWNLWTRRADPTRVVFFLGGGGACWNELTCRPTAGFYKTVITADDDPHDRGGIFDFDQAENPLADWSWVVVPYCTGDIHLGDRTASYGDLTVEHNGLVNGRRAIEEMVEQFPDATEILVAGSSAGGVAAPLYAGLIAEEYPGATITALADASGAYPNESSAEIADNWGVVDSLPSWATAESAEFTIPGLVVAASNEYPQINFARYDNADDEVQRGFIAVAGIDTGTASTVAESIDQTEAFIEDAIGEVPAYVAPGPDHTILGIDDFFSVSVDGVTVRDWLVDLLDDGDAPDVPADP